MASSDELESLTPDSTDKPDSEIDSEAKRIQTVETLITSFVQSKLVVSADGKTVTNNMSSKEIRDIAAAQKDVIEMRRKNTGRHE